MQDFPDRDFAKITRSMAASGATYTAVTTTAVFSAAKFEDMAVLSSPCIKPSVTGLFSPRAGIRLPRSGASSPLGASPPAYAEEEVPGSSDLARLVRFLEDQRRQEREERRTVEQQVADLRKLEREELERSRREARLDRAISKLPRLGPDEDVDAFLTEFIAVSDLYELNDRVRAEQLRRLVSGGAREAIAGLPLSTSFRTLVSTIRKRFQLTAEDYRRKFRGARKEYGDFCSVWQSDAAFFQ